MAKEALIAIGDDQLSSFMVAKAAIGGLEEELFENLAIHVLAEFADAQDGVDLDLAALGMELNESASKRRLK